MKNRFLVIILLLSICMVSSFLSSPSHAYAEAEMDFHMFFEEHGSIMLLVDAQTGEIEHANKAAADFYGYTQEQLESMKIQDLSVKLRPEEVLRQMQVATDNENNYFVYEHRLAQGETRLVEAYTCPHIQGEKRYLFFTIYDITEKTHLALRNKMLTDMLIFLLAGAVVFAVMVSVVIYSNKRKTEELNASFKAGEEKLRILLDSTAEGIYGIDLEGRCTFCNKSCLKMLGYKSPEELIGKNMHWQIHHKRPDGETLPLEECRIFQAFLKGEGTHVDDEVLWRADGTCFPAEYYSYPQLRNGEVIGAVVTFTDITARKQAENKILEANRQLESLYKQLLENQDSLEEQNALIEELNAQLMEENMRYQEQKDVLQAIIDSLTAGIAMIDTAGKIVFVNKAWKKMFSYAGYSHTRLNEDFYVDEVAGGNTDEFFRSILAGMENRGEIFDKLHGLAGDFGSRVVIDIEQKEPFERFLNMYSNPCISNTNNCYGRIFVIRDVSHQKEVDRLKMELISTVSHELRTPMSSILGFSELLLTRELPPERKREYIKTINSEAQRLTNLVNDFLDIQRIESGRQEFNMQFNSIEKIIVEALKLFDKIGDKHNISYNKGEGDIPEVYCDKDKILQVLSNLLSNAIKFSPKGGDIDIRAAYENGEVIVSVSDRGLGIPEDARDKLFTKFYRVDNDDRRDIGGTGLGLAICKEIVLAHGGTIDYESAYGKGSTFYFSLPRVKENGQP